MELDKQSGISQGLNADPPSPAPPKSAPPKLNGRTVFRATLFDTKPAVKYVMYRDLVPILVGLGLANLVCQVGNYGDFALYICSAMTVPAALKFISNINFKFPHFEFGLNPVNVPGDVNSMTLFAVTVRDCATGRSPKGQCGAIFAALKQQNIPALSMFIKASDIPFAESNTCKFFFAAPEAALDMLGHVIRIGSTEYVFTGDEILISKFTATLRPGSFACVRVSKLNCKAYNLPTACGEGLREYLSTAVDKDNVPLDIKNLTIHCCEVKGQIVGKKYINNHIIIACLTGAEDEALCDAARHLINCSPLNLGEAGNGVIVEDVPSRLFATLSTPDSDAEKSDEELAIVPEDSTAGQIYLRNKAAISSGVNKPTQTAPLAATTTPAPTSARPPMVAQNQTAILFGIEKSINNLAEAVHSLQRKVTDQELRARETHQMALTTAKELADARGTKKARADGNESDRSTSNAMDSMTLSKN